jgi:hypothetical protein
MDNFLLTLSGAIRATKTTSNSTVCDTPGIYAVFVRDINKVGTILKEALTSRNTNLLYIGKADSLYTRLICQDLRHESPASFFRGIGAVLGYVPEYESMKNYKRKNNYKFSKEDTVEICRWIDDNLVFDYVLIDDGSSILKKEKDLIREYKPLMNHTHNPEKWKFLIEVREKCRRIAGGG